MLNEKSKPYKKAFHIQSGTKTPKSLKTIDIETHMEIIYVRVGRHKIQDSGKERMESVKVTEGLQVWWNVLYPKLS